MNLNHYHKVVRRSGSYSLILLIGVLLPLSISAQSSSPTKARVSLLAEGAGSASVGGRSTGEGLEFEIGSTHEVSLSADPGGDGLTVFVNASCGVEVLVRHKTKETRTASINATPQVFEDTTPWENKGPSAKFYDYEPPSGGGDDVITEASYPITKYEVISTELQFQSTADVAARSQSANDPTGSGGSGGGGSASPGNIMGYPPLSEEAFMVPSNPRPQLDQGCCGGGLSAFPGATMVPSSSLRPSTLCGYEFPLGGFILPYRDRGASFGRLVFKGDINATNFAEQLSTVLTVEGMVQEGRIAVFPGDNGRSYIALAMPQSLIVHANGYPLPHAFKVEADADHQ